VAIAEPSQQLAAEYAARSDWSRNCSNSDLEEAIQKTHPDAVLAYTNTLRSSPGG